MATVNEYRGNLYCLGRFPAKDGSGTVKQTRFALHLKATPAGYKKAERMVKLINDALLAGSFKWEDWITQTRGGYSWRRAIDDLYDKRVTRGRTSQKTWDVSYMGLLKQLDPVGLVTTQSLMDAMQRYERDQFSYKHLYYLCKDIAVLAGVPFPQVGLPTYGGAKRVKVPSRQEILDWVLGAPQPHRWYLGMIATYGLRPHEVDRLDQIDNDLVQVWNETKTGFRTVIPLEPEWVELFDLKNKQQRPASSREDQRPDACSQWLYKQNLKQKITYKTYALRHAYAARLWEMGGSEMDIYTASMLMGHSVKEHLSTYRAHIDPHRIASTAKEAITRHQAKQP